jgi:hypothetical protein
VAVLEDDRWNNNGWIDMPIFGYLSEEDRRAINVHTPHGINVIADGEYFGGGLLPTCIPEPLYEAAELGASGGFRAVMSRFDFHDRTEMGTTRSVNEINFIASLLPLWEPVPTLDALWEEWAARRFGPEAAPLVLPALKSGGEIITKGCMVAGVDMLIGSIFKPHTMVDLKPGQPFYHFDYFKLFRPAGTPLLELKEGEPLRAIQFKAHQLGIVSPSIVRVREDQRRALDLLDAALRAIRSAEPFLAPDDFCHLMRVYTTCLHVVRAVRAASEAIYMNRILRDNFDRVENPSEKYRLALDNLETVACECEAMRRHPHFDAEYDHVPESLRKLAVVLAEKEG